ncbi:uncharacterized mitochondrial protein AtMg00810-like [Amaranthus tricolor]|uniref:uncharacterized mitochondrial protein AtMg00810-like n=1 Tax=Amaranthus tricolor TaxID=29722 RepID=UPI00258E56DE|nr:uncharacterized mitochondrial protein AtMg00810-like [Amaranthus tricolor]
MTHLLTPSNPPATPTQPSQPPISSYPLTASAASNTSLFIYRLSSEVAYLLLYFDDIIHTASSEPLRKSIKSRVSSEFAMKDLGPLHYFLCIAVSHISSCIFLSQKKYAVDILEQAGMSDCKLAPTPADTSGKLSAHFGPPHENPTLYRCSAGALQYLTFAHPNISYVVQQIPLVARCD